MSRLPSSTCTSPPWIGTNDNGDLGRGITRPANVRFVSTLVIENSEPNFRKGSEADIQTETLPARGRYLALNVVSARKQAREREALAAVAMRSQAIFDRAESLLANLWIL
jgi:hypothetical protein